MIFFKWGDDLEFSKKLKTSRRNEHIKDKSQTPEIDAVEVATFDDLDELEKLYDDLNDYLDSGINYSGWKKDVYPVRETASDAIEIESLFVIKRNKEIAGTLILNHKQDQAYEGAKWSSNLSDREVMVVHTLAISPKYMKQGIALKLMKFVKDYSEKLGMKSIRLDVSVENTPAIELYEKLGYVYIDTVDLGLKDLNRIWFRLYEYNLKLIEVNRW